MLVRLDTGFYPVHGKHDSKHPATVFSHLQARKPPFFTLYQFPPPRKEDFHQLRTKLQRREWLSNMHSPWKLSTPPFTVDLSRTSATALPSNSHRAQGHTSFILRSLLPGIASLQDLEHFKTLPPSLPP